MRLLRESFWFSTCVALWGWFALLGVVAAGAFVPPLLAIEVLDWPRWIVVLWACVFTPLGIALLAAGFERLADWVDSR